MSFLIAAPEALAAAAADLGNIGSLVREANAAAVGPTSGVLAAGTDEVSAAIAPVFARYAQQYQAIGVQASVFNDRFAQVLSAGAGS